MLYLSSAQHGLHQPLRGGFGCCLTYQAMLDILSVRRRTAILLATRLETRLIMSTSQHSSPPVESLHIFVNRRKFAEDAGVRPTMRGAEIAALVGVPSDVAVVRRGEGVKAVEVGVDETLQLRQAEHFLVTRRVVEGGYHA
jgi:hypothetical protein